MDQNERRIIDDLFEKLGRVEGDAPPRDPEAEALIRRHLESRPAVPYYMAQAIVVQEQALANAQARVQELERKARPSGGGFLSGLFGGGEEAQDRGPARGQAAHPGAFGRSGGGFLGGAMQTALGVAGGVLIADAIASAFAPDEAAAAEASPEDAGSAGSEDWAAPEDMPADEGFDFGEF